MKLLGVIGYPLGHSISPAFQQAALDHLSFEMVYERWKVEPSRLAELMAWARGEDFLGANVTVPHKRAVMSYLDEIDPWAKKAGAVNTIVHRGGRLYGHNTDGLGFLRSLKEEGCFDPQGKRVLVIGAGGAARAVVLALSDEGAADMVIANRTIERARELVRLAQSHGVLAKEVPLERRSLVESALRKDLIVNCTVTGMKDGPLEGKTPLKAEDIPEKALVYDLVYNPSETPLLREAKKAGALPLSGLGMLVYQGAASFQMWTGREAPVDVMYSAAKRALEFR